MSAAKANTKASTKADTKAKKQASRSAVKKSAVRKGASKAAGAKKKSAKKEANKKSVSKTSVSKKSAGKTSVGKKSATKKVAVKKNISKKVTAKKSRTKAGAKTGAKASSKTGAKKKPVSKAVAKSSAKSSVKPSAKSSAKSSMKSFAGKGKTSDGSAPTPVKQYDFKDRDAVVYPRHGVGQVIKIETAIINNKKIKLLAVSFEGDRMIMRIPYDRASETGLRPISSRGVMNKVMVILAGKARVRRTMWSRRAQEYTNKIQSGDVIAIGEVVRELWRDPAQPEQSFSERQMYQHALSRLAREYGAVYKITEEAAIVRLEAVMQKSPKTSAKPPSPKK